jgi:hypothetical protein
LSEKSEKKEAPRGKPSIVRKKASATMPSPVSAKIAAKILDNDQDFDDATVISSEFSGFKIPRSNTTNSASATPVPNDTYDPKNLSAKESTGPATVEVSSKATRPSPAIVGKKGTGADPAPAKVPARTTPAIIRTKARAASSATVETPKLVAEELSAKLALPTPAPPDSSPRQSEPPKAKGRNRTGIIVVLVLLVGAGIGAVVLLAGGDSSEKQVEEPVVVTKPADDSVGNLTRYRFWWLPGWQVQTMNVSPFGWDPWLTNFRNSAMPR